jgi:sigma-B regulation protein RsbU (phosphoserine phosphatase)
MSVVYTEAGKMPRALIADDQPDVLEALRLLLKNEGYQTEAVGSPAGVLDALKGGGFDLLLMDLNYARDTTSGREGMDLVSHVRAMDGNLPIIVMTAWGSVPLAVEALQKGVGDFVEKPWDNSKLLEILRTQLERSRTLREANAEEEKHRAAQEKLLSRLRLQDQEIQQAREMQQSLMPREIPEIPGYEFSGAWRPARCVGGDYFDVLPLGETSYGLCIADVMGKGVPAALLMSNLQAAVRSSAPEPIAPADLCRRVNLQLCRNTTHDRFVTFFYAVLNATARRLTYTNAGHNAPILLRGDGSVERLDAGGPVIGMFPEIGYEQSVIELREGDRLALFTDGVTELHDAAGEEFGEERLTSLVRANQKSSAEELRVKIFAAADEYGGGEFQDDATLIVMAVT